MILGLAHGLHEHPQDVVHDPAGWQLPVFQGLVLVVLAAGAVGYGVALRSGRGRRRWPVHRTVLWYLGLACAGASLIGPLAAAGHTSFVAHMITHLLLGMLAPLLLVLAAPISVLLRALPASAGRAITRVLRSTWVRWASHPLVAAVLNAGGLWVLYATGLFALMHESIPVHALVHLHIFLAGYLLTYALVGVDPNPHRASMPLRCAVLIAFIAAHSALSKWLYAHPPAGVDIAQARTGAQLMYYGGDVVDVALIVLLFSGWYAATRPRPAAAAR